tara:strand:- start:1075 stop:1320 length:246 start_codon:yes stop_codon:yes gene_type:complete
MNEKKFERIIIIFCVLVILLLGLTSCATKQKEYKPGPLGAVVENAEDIGKYLGCAFAPHTCREMEEEEEWKKVDEDIKKSK